MKLGVGNVHVLRLRLRLRLHCRHLSHLHAIVIPSPFASTTARCFNNPPLPSPPPTQKNDTEVVLPLLRLLKRCSSLSHVKQLHAHLVVTGPLAGPSPPSLLHALVRTYNAVGCLTHAVLLFDRSPPPPTNLLWNVLIRAYSKSTRPQESILLLRRMLLLTLPDNYTFTFSIAACSRVGNPRSKTGEGVHCLAIKSGCGADCDLFVGNSLVGMYSVASRIDDARKVFEEMAARDVVSWTSLIDGYAGVGELGVAKELFEEMPDRNNISWAVIISGHVSAGMYEDAIKHFHHMMRCSSVKPNEAILVCVLSACAHMGALEQGKWLHAYIDKSKAVWSSNVSTALIDLYAKCGRIDCAKQVFDTSLRRDIWTWTSLISGLAMHGLGSDALRIFNQMVNKGIVPDTVTLLGVLNGCSHSGLVKEGTAIFYEMDRLWGISPEIEHYGCLIDLLGRAGKVEKAFKTVMTMPLEPDVVIWRSLLSACRIHGDVGLAECVLVQIAKLYPTSHGEGRVLLSNLYAAMDRWEGVSKMRSICNSEASGQFSPGCSWIEVNGVVHKFLAAERFHSQIVDIRNKLVEVLNRVSHEGGYVPNTENVLFDLSEEEKEQAVSWHSEKLAVAFGLMSTEQGSCIRIMKNLRICGDCHSLIKAVSLVFHREIVVRDRSRFHTFLGGNCSCNDYWRKLGARSCTELMV